MPSRPRRDLGVKWIAALTPSVMKISRTVPWVTANGGLVRVAINEGFKDGRTTLLRA
jgi:hypothetical protein